ncbi:MAG TPA: hypothetical protein VMF53_06895 [Alphaproteobacteria bacterium]|nr:hypothetical protein [Alphaproteobacteria bacterium]
MLDEAEAGFAGVPGAVLGAAPVAVPGATTPPAGWDCAGADPLPPVIQSGRSGRSGIIGPVLAGGVGKPLLQMATHSL